MWFLSCNVSFASFAWTGSVAFVLLLLVRQSCILEVPLTIIIIINDPWCRCCSCELWSCLSSLLFIVHVIHDASDSFMEGVVHIPRHPTSTLSSFSSSCSFYFLLSNVLNHSSPRHRRISSRNGTNATNDPSLSMNIDPTRV